MSAYVVDRNHIRYIICAAEWVEGRQDKFRWLHDSLAEGWDTLTPEKAGEVGQMLWDTNAESVGYRYDTPVDGDLPGPNDQTRVYWHVPAAPVWEPDLAQLFMSLDCYEYQSCEHDGWETLNAHAFIRSLRHSAWRRLPGYRDAEWGAPEVPTSTAQLIVNRRRP